MGENSKHLHKNQDQEKGVKLFLFPLIKVLEVLARTIKQEKQVTGP